MKLPEGNFKAYLYDCDGTLADTMRPHTEAWIEEVGKHGVIIPGSLIHELAGMPATRTVEEINKRYGSKLDPEAIAASKEKLFYENYMGRIYPIVEVVESLRAAYGNKKIAVVSGGRTRIVHRTLELLGIADLVEVVICAEDVKHGKPHPEPFLMAAERLGVKPEDCLVFEDADFGIESATRAGMKWIRIPS
jgi:HAD superfamily hydrolase (TIGR01509 family)